MSNGAQIISISLNWEPVLIKNGERYRYPAELSYLKESAMKPAVYRWSFLFPSRTQPEYLIGETGTLYHRLQAYLRGEGKHAPEMKKCGEIGGKVHLDVLRFTDFDINGVVFSIDTLKRAFVRGVLENLCCAALQDQGFTVRNQLWKE